MSRLDYVTVGIVAVCLAALGFLVFKTVGLMNGNGNAELETQAAADYVDPYPIDSTGKDTTSFTDPAFSGEGVTSYSEEDDRSRDIVSDSKTTAKSGTETTKKTENVKPEVKKTETTPKKTETTKATETKSAKPKETTTVKPKVVAPTTKEKATTERYFVQAGAFSARANAETLVKELKKLGYADAKVEITKSSAKALAVVDYFSSRSDADALVKALKSKHNIDALVKEK